jgi:hypothetical protein
MVDDRRRREGRIRHVGASVEWARTLLGSLETQAMVMEAPIRVWERERMSGAPLPRLYRLRDMLESAALPDVPADEAAMVRETARWVRAYTTGPHPALGRPGPVCPWVEESIDRGLCLIGLVHRGDEDEAPMDEVVSALGSYYLAMEPQAGHGAQFKAIVTVFAGLDPEEAPDYINGLHLRLKPSFVARGMMLGEFFPSCDKPGLRNPEFRPLRSPLPLLVIRPMVRQDIVFLSDRMEFIRAYLGVHQQAGCQEILSSLAKNDARIDRDTGLRLLDAVRECYGSWSQLAPI